MKITDDNLKTTKKIVLKIDDELSTLIKTSTDTIFTQIEAVLSEEPDSMKGQVENLKQVVSNVRTDLNNKLHAKIRNNKISFNI